MFLRCFGDVHMWGQIWPHKVWASLCQVLFFSNLLHSHGVWHFDVWQIISKYNMSCDTQPFTPLPPTTAPSPPSPNPTPNPQRASMCNSYTPRYFDTAMSNSFLGGNLNSFRPFSINSKLFKSIKKLLVFSKIWKLSWNIYCILFDLCEKSKYCVVYVTSTCWLVTFLTLLSDVAKRQFQNMQKKFT